MPIWAEEVASLVTSEYHELAATTLERVRREETALRRLKTTQAAAAASSVAGGGGGEGAGEVSDSSKICMQLCLDVAAYAEELRKIGVQPSELEAFAKLQDQVRPDAELMQAVGASEQADDAA